MTLLPITQFEFDSVYTQLENNFIPDERRERKDARALLEDPAFTMYHILKNNEKVGFVTVWELDSFDFIEHFVIYEIYRNQGLGAKTLDLLKSRGKKLVLEAELPTDELQKRRVAFYQRCDFVKNPFDYTQPPYKKGGLGVPMVLLSCPNACEDFENTVKQIYQKVYNLS